MRRSAVFLDLLLIILLSAVLIQPLFRAKYLDRWDSIEATYIADGRLLSEHLPHPLWQPLWYCGTRFDYIYPPVVRYGTALLSRVFVPAQAHHIFSGLLYCLGIAGVYFLVLVMTGSRGAAWLAASGAALVSPAAWLLRDIRLDSPHMTPWRLWVMVRDGEGPHVSAVSLLPFALAFAFLALRGRRPAALACAAFFSAAVALTNFYGSTGLGILFPVLVWSVWVSTGDHMVWLRGAAIALLAYGLAAFWLTPSYFRITVENLKWFSPPGDPGAQILFACAVLAFLAGSSFLGQRRTAQTYHLFVLGGLLLLGVNVLGYAWYNIRALAEPHRLETEFDLLVLLAGVELIRRCWNWSSSPSRVRLARGLAALMVLCLTWRAAHYVRHAWELYPADPDYTTRVEYRMPDWISRHLPHSRTFATGSVRFWWNAWQDTAQVGGGCDRGVLNQILLHAMYQVTFGTNTEAAVRWLTALGVDAVIVHDARSQEMYHDFKHPDKFAGALPVLFDDRHGDVIYGVPRRYPSLARVVDASELQAMRPIEPVDNLAALRAYTTVIEEGPDSPTTTAWSGTDALRVHARVAQGQSILVQVTYDPAWHAYAGGQALPVHKDRVTEFSVIETLPGERDIAFVFETPLENRIGWVLTWLSLAVVAGLVVLDYVRRRASAMRLAASLPSESD